MPCFPDRLRAGSPFRSILNPVCHRPVGYGLSFRTRSCSLQVHPKVLASTGMSQKSAPALLSSQEPHSCAGHSLLSNRIARRPLHNEFGALPAMAIPIPGSPVIEDVPPRSVLSRLTPLQSSPILRESSMLAVESKPAFNHNVLVDNSIEHSPTNALQSQEQMSTEEWTQQVKIDCAVFRFIRKYADSW